MPRTPAPDARGTSAAGRAPSARGGNAPRRRLARGEQRIAQLLDAAAAEFAAVGYEAATTNRIAARAGASPGTLYQFFPNKEAMARELAAGFLVRISEEFDFLLDPAPGTGKGAATCGGWDGPTGTGAAGSTGNEAEDTGTLRALVDRVVDPVVGLSRSCPAFQAIFTGTSGPRMAASTAELHRALHRVMEALLALVLPGLPPERRDRSAAVLVHIVKATLTASAGPAEYDDLTEEFKHVVCGYLAGLSAEPAL